MSLSLLANMINTTSLANYDIAMNDQREDISSSNTGIRCLYEQIVRIRGLLREDGISLARISVWCHEVSRDLNELYFLAPWSGVVFVYFDL